MENDVPIRALLALAMTLCLNSAVFAQSLTDRSGNADSLPIVPDGFQIEFAAKEPLVRNPCAMAFDFHGRLCVGMGPQYRSPKPDTPGDSVFLMIDEDGDGRFDSKKRFATGFNSIQSIAWRGRDLWIANAPDLTVVRDLDGDDIADKYVRVFTDLGNLEHGLHGLNWGPDGRLYMSKGNSKGLTQPGRIAPKPFRDLWGVTAPEGSLDFPPPVKSGSDDYQKNYHNPADDWGREGGVLVCDDGGKNLEIVSRGFRNPWDIAYDSGFNWQGTDNDQNEGDRVFTPFYGSHYGWGHPWSAHWTGREHPPTAPISGPVFHGSGTGIVFYEAKQFPEKYRGVWFFNDWLRRTVFFYRPTWEGALIQPEGGQWQPFITGGKSLFKPTDIEVGPDGSMYILGWGRAYGAEFDKDGKQSNEGRIFRIWWEGSDRLSVTPFNAEPEARTSVAAESKDNSPPAATNGSDSKTPPRPDSRLRLNVKRSRSKFEKPISKWTHEELVEEFDSPIPARRIGVQGELIRRDTGKEFSAVFGSFDRSGESVSQQTWTLWTAGRLDLESSVVDDAFAKLAREMSRPLNARIQSLRILGHRIRHSQKWRPLPEDALQQVFDEEPRIRLAAVLAIRRAKQNPAIDVLLDALSQESDRVVFYAGWQTMREISPSKMRHQLLTDPRPLVRRAALLSLAEDRDLAEAEVKPLLGDEDDVTRQVAALWIAKQAGSPFLMVSPPPGEFEGRIEVGVLSAMKPADVRVTTDGSEPTLKSPRWSGKISISKTTTLRAAVFVKGRVVGPIATLPYRQLSAVELAGRSGIVSVRAESGRGYRVVEGGLATGKPAYTDRDYRFEELPSELKGSLLIRTANDDSGSRGSGFLYLDTVLPMTVFVGYDTRVAQPPEWLDSKNGFSLTKLAVRTNDATFRIYSRSFEAGQITLGGNTNDSDPGGKSNYIVILKPLPLPKLVERTTIAQSLPLVDKADAARGKAIFFAKGGAGCSKCHRADGAGKSFGPDLAHLVQKRDPLHIVKSMLDPSSEIKEGFATQTIVTKGGKTISGLLREQTAGALTLAQPDGPDILISVDKIGERFSQKVSAMPDFNLVLKPQDIADVTAWLMTRPSPRPAGVPGPVRKGHPAVDETGKSARPTGPETYSSGKAAFSFQEKSDRIVVKLNGYELGTYLYGHKKMTRPGWVHVYSPSGIQMTRDFPPKDDSGDHRFMHPGIWISFGHLDGEDYWRLQSRTKHVEFAKEPWSKPGQAGFTVRNQYLRKDGKTVVCEELTKYTFIARPQGVLMLVQATFQSDRHDFYFGDQEESGLAIRVETQLNVSGGSGSILNSNGQKNGAACWGHEANWVDYFGTVSGRKVGLMVMPGPDNARRCWMHTRDYGLIAANPFPKQPKERREPYVKTVIKKGEPFRLSYGVLIHDEPVGSTLDRKSTFEDVARLLKSDGG
jgi:putative membrane-bound dehydrogenase-like protein